MSVECSIVEAVLHCNLQTSILGPAPTTSLSERKSICAQFAFLFNLRFWITTILTMMHVRIIIFLGYRGNAIRTIYLGEMDASC